MSVFQVFGHRAFAVMWAGRVANHIAALVQSVTIGWWVYTLARLTYDEKTSAFFVGMIGLAQFLPMFALALVAGEAADRYDRRKILLACGLLQSFCALAFMTLSLSGCTTLWPIFCVAALFGVGRAFIMPATSALLPATVPFDVLPKAIAWSTLSVQSGRVFGPLLGGFLSAYSPSLANAASSLLFLGTVWGSFVLLKMPIAAKPVHSGAPRMQMIMEGVSYLRKTRAVLAAISLDLFAVLLGGVTALLPVFAKDILHVGSQGFGLLSAAVALGGGGMTFCLAMRPITRHLGRWMLGGVAMFGFVTVLFSLSTNFWFSWCMLLLAGVGDSLSVFVRQNLVQILTPDAMRGRVSAVSGLFISASNELGEFESGVTARFLGAIGSGVVGGLGSMAIVALWAKLFPELRNIDKISPPEPQPRPAN